MARKKASSGKKFTRSATPRGKVGATSTGVKATGGPGIFSNFESAKFSNKRSWIWSSWPTDFRKTMTVFDRLETTRKMRWMELNAGIIRQVLSDYVLYSVGDGITAQVRTGNPKLDEAYEQYFDKWARVPCDITGRFNLYELQQIVARLVMRDGECFPIKTKDASGLCRVQLIESHRVGSNQSAAPEPKEVDGIIFGKYGKPESYNVIKTDGSGRKVPAGAVMHVYTPEVASGARAYSPLQHSINNVVDMLEIISLEKFAVKMNSDVVRTISREPGQFDNSQADFEAFGMRPNGYPAGGNNITDANEASTFIGGKILALNPGEKLESFESNRPNPTFTGFMEHLVRDSLAGTLPYEFVHDPSKAGGASMRLVVAKADRQFKQLQTVLINRFLTPLWGYVIGTAIKNGELPANDNWTRVFWTTPKRLTVDASRDSAQNRADIAMGIKTLGDNAQEDGEHLSTLIKRRVREAKAIMDECAAEGVPLWMVYKPDNVAISDVTANSSTAVKPPDENEDAEEDMEDDYRLDDENLNPGDTPGSPS
ncbi:MAG: phage portal protein [Opitutia bacterium]